MKLNQIVIETKRKIKNEDLWVYLGYNPESKVEYNSIFTAALRQKILVVSPHLFIQKLCSKTQNPDPSIKNNVTNLIVSVMKKCEAMWLISESSTPSGGLVVEWLLWQSLKKPLWVVKNLE